MLKKLHIVVVLLVFSTVCSAYEADSYFCIYTDTESIDNQDNKVKNKSSQFFKIKLRSASKDTLVKKVLPKEFPDNYHQEYEAFKERLRFRDKAIRAIKNTRNYTSFSTNMLYDIVLIPNIAAEFSLTPHLSLSTTYMHSWWSFKSSNIYWRVYGCDLALKYWFGKKSNTRRLTGHHIGVYAQALTYDFDLGGQAQMSEGWNKAVGFEYGHSFAIAKNLNIDVYAGIGLLTGRYKDYSNIDDHYVWQLDVKRQTYLPTKFGASLVWVLPFKLKSILYEE